MRQYAQLTLRQHPSVTTFSFASPWYSHSLNYSSIRTSSSSLRSGYSRSRPKKTSSLFRTGQRHAYIATKYSVSPNPSSNASMPLSPSSPSTSSPLSPTINLELTIFRQNPRQYRQPPHQCNHLRQPHQRQNNFSRRQQFRPFSTSSSSGPGAGSGPRLATFNQVRRGCRKEQRARIPTSPAMAFRTQLKGVCLKVGITKPKKPNSGQRKIARVRLSSGKVVTAYIPGEGEWDYSLFSFLFLFRLGWSV